MKVPLVIDSTDEKVIEKALTYSQGKVIINSINLEDGEERFDAILPLVKNSVQLWLSVQSMKQAWPLLQNEK